MDAIQVWVFALVIFLTPAKTGEISYHVFTDKQACALAEASMTQDMELAKKHGYIKDFLIVVCEKAGKFYGEWKPKKGR